jgi:5-methylcytosine-specific restriction endonuclease McrA
VRLPIRGEYAENRQEIHDATRAAAGNRCIRCGHPQGDKLGRVISRERLLSGGTATEYALDPVPCTEHCTHPKDGKLRILTVHHLNGDKADNRWWNLLALCQVCHLQVQARVLPEWPWLFAHSPWFVPYVCGFYAAYYGGLEITREQADADPDRWLAMGQPWLYAGRAS